jgi:hypothetical protein
MSSTTSANSTLAIFGATGGTGLAILKNFLSAGYSVNVLVRTPSKLSSILSEYPKLLRVIEGDIHNVSSIKQALVLDNRLVDIVISAVGMPLSLKGIKVVSPDPTICEVGTSNITSALSGLETEFEQESSNPPNNSASRSKTKLIILSTTGISETRDVPLLIKPLYDWGLAIPHTDKKKMEAVVINSRWPWVLIRPSFLVDGPAKGLGSVKTGIETPTSEDKAKPALGYTIRREDVGLWIFEECVSSSGHWENWAGKGVSLTY